MRDEAAAWQVRMLEPSSEAEVAAFERWLQADPAHAEAYDEVQSISSMGERLPRRLLSEPSALTSSRLQPAFGVAFVVIFMLAAGLWLANPGTQPAYAAVSNPGPSVRGVRLSDGTRVILDSGAELAIAIEEHARNVRILAGRARFSVAPDEGRPFSVLASAATVTARGTVFDVAVDGEEASIFVINGEVDVAPAERGSQIAAAAVTSGQAIRVHDGRISQTAVHPSEARWPVSRLAFDETPLATIVGMANRGSDPDIELQYESIGSLKVTGVLDIRDTRDLARKLAATRGLHIEESGGSITLTR